MSSQVTDEAKAPEVVDYPESPNMPAVISPLNGEQPLFARLGHQDIQTLEGRLLTLADSSFPDREQRRAFKSILRREIWIHWANNLDRRLSGDEYPVGIPCN